MKRRGFTLVELMIATMVASLVIASGFKIIGITFNGMKENNKEVDIETEVRTSLKDIATIVKSSKQLFFAGKNVIDPERLSDNDYLKTRDKHFSYLVVKKDPINGDQLINLMYDSKSKSWLQVPLTSGTKIRDAKKNDVYDGVAKYSISFYKDNSNYVEDMNKHLVDVTVSGELTENKKVKQYELTETIDAQNVNQISMAKNFYGGVENITCLAYSRYDVKAQVSKTGDDDTYAIAFVIDLSGSMDSILDRSKHRSRLDILKDALTDDGYGFLSNINKTKVDPAERKKSGKEAKIKTFFIPFDDDPFLPYIDFQNPKKGMNYLATYRSYRRRPAGPYNLTNSNEFQNAKNYVNDMRTSGATNYGEPILDALFALKYSGANHKYLIFLSDGIPNFYTVCRDNKHEFFIGKGTRKTDYDYSGKVPMDYVKVVTDPKNGWNVGVEKVFLIGYSNNPRDKVRIGFNRNPLENSLYAYFKQSPDLKGGESDPKKDKVQVADAKSEDSLIKALSSIAKVIQYDMNVFEGPKDSN